MKDIILGLGIFVVIASIVIAASIKISPYVKYYNSIIDQRTDNILKICRIMKENPLILNCSVPTNNFSFDVLANLSPAGAYALCEQVQNSTALNSDWHFYGYSMRVFSPMSGGYPIAICKLPD